MVKSQEHSNPKFSYMLVQVSRVMHQIGLDVGVCRYVCMYVRMYVRMYVCMYVYNMYVSDSKCELDNSGIIQTKLCVRIT